MTSLQQPFIHLSLLRKNFQYIIYRKGANTGISALTQDTIWFVGYHDQGVDSL